MSNIPPSQSPLSRPPPSSPNSRPIAPYGPHNPQTRPPMPGVSPSPPLPAGYRPPGFRPGNLQNPSGRPLSYPNQTAMGPNYQVMSANSTSPPPVENPESPSQRSQTPPSTSHKPKRLYPKEITEVYTESNAYGNQYQPFTPAVAPGGIGQQIQPPAIDQNAYQQSQFFTPAGDQNYQAAAPSMAPTQYSQQYPQQYPQQYTQHPSMNASMGGLTNQLNNMNLGGHSQAQLITVNLIGTLPNVADLDAPPPPINLPPNSSVTQSDKANCEPSYKRCTVNCVPTNASLLSKSRLPFGLIITPYRSLKEGDEPVPVITDTVIARCRRCRTYINPFVTFAEGGQKWRCNLCFLLNEVPSQFDWDIQTSQQANRWKRAELNHAVVEYVRPPQPPVYLFVIDVSFPAIQSGAVATAARTILESLDRIPNEENRTKIGVITVDTSLHFYSLNSNSSEPQMLVVSDLEDVFLPQPDDLLVNLTEARPVIESLLSRLGDMFKDTHTVGNALGSAMLAGFKLISPIGGKIIVLQSSLPNIGPGQLKAREDSKALGTPKESALLQSAEPFYKKFAVDCSRSQVSVDMFLLGSQYSDVATLSRSEDALKFAHEFAEFLASPIALEAVMRVRASKGLRMTSFYGNFFVRQTDLLALPSVSRDHSYAIEVSIEENIATPTVCFQTALLHTTCFGERRIRVLTLSLPVTNSITELYSSADQIAISTLLANKAVERSLSSKLEDARDALTNKMIDILGVYKSSITGSQGASPQLQISDNMKLLPLLALGLLKHVGLRASSQIPTDLRAYAMCLLTTMPSQLLIPYLHPRFYSLHNMPIDVGTYGPDGIIMPPPLNLSSEKLERHGAYLLEDGQNIFIWLGRQVVPQLCMDLLNVRSYEEVRSGKVTLLQLDNSFSQQVNAIIGKTRESRRGVYYPHLYIVKEDGGDPSLRLWFLSHIIEDRTDTVMSYQQWLGHLKDKINSGSF
ncbi:10705_t:CDS:10 [Dentiscutata erythropus]|uniref:10705_t:CDS:1 n=1 Tax=Dentiscutata erythropus TaxID=1348616 RepID=A0A9N9FRL2_9GLOM|nr:10705_t:CDS:10 [Dentiscutata erythropus]